MNMDNSSARSRKKGSLRRRPQALIFAVALILFAFVAGGIYGKYVQQANGDGIVTADAFYFESNVLDEPNSYGEYPTYELAAGTTSIAFSLDNFADDLRYAGYDIQYVVASSGGTITDTGSGKITGGSKNSSTIEVSGLSGGQTYTITAKTTNGYYKIIGAQFTVLADTSGLYAYLDTDTDSHYVELILWSDSVSGTITATAPSGLIPDVTKGVSGTTNVSLAEDASVKLRYFRETPGKAFSLSNFTLSGSPVGVTPGTPN